MSFLIKTLKSLNCGSIHSKTSQLLREIVLYILNTPGKSVKKVLETMDFLNDEGVRTLINKYISEFQFRKSLKDVKFRQC